MVEFIAQLILLGEKLLVVVVFFVCIMAIIWTFQLLRDPGKQLDLAMDLFKSIFVWAWKIILFFWMAIVYVLNLFKRILAITFATIRDFFVSKN
jgi:hypothetical protein